MTAVAPTWLFETVQLMFVGVPALAGDAERTSALAPMTAMVTSEARQRVRRTATAAFRIIENSY